MSLSRRSFLKSASVSTTALAAAGPNLLLGQAKGANDRLRVGVMGLSRGRGHIRSYLDVPNCEVAYVCDVDQNRLAACARSLEGKQERAPQQVGDFRRILDDPEIDALSIAAPDFWHASATILACQAGKHVYAEKPGSYDPHEAKRVVEVVESTQRKVQFGTQRRSFPGMIEGVQKLREGIIGKLLYARCWYANQRPSMGKGTVTSPPPELDWTLWQGPLPERPYRDNLVHYNWHWRWFYSGGELLGNGVHFLDTARWAMGVGYPNRITCNGGRYHYDDDQETPDTVYAVYDYGDEGGISWEGSSCHRRKPETLPFVSVYGEGGKIDFSSSNYTAFDLDGKEIARNRDKPSDVPHFTNFANAIREDEPLAQDIATGQVSSMLCHLGNIAYRTGGALTVNPATGELVNGSEGQKKLWKREAYREGWEI